MCLFNNVFKGVSEQWKKCESQLVPCVVNDFSNNLTRDRKIPAPQGWRTLRCLPASNRVNIDTALGMQPDAVYQVFHSTLFRLHGLMQISAMVTSK